MIARKVRTQGFTRPMMGWLLGLVALAAMAVLAVKYSGGPNAAPPAPERVVLAVNTEYVGSCPMIAAIDKGYFEQAGVQAVLQPYSSGKAAMDAVIQGKADLGTAADIPVMFASLSGAPVAVIATIFKADSDHGIVGRTDKGIGAPASLKGKAIGLTLGASSNFALDAFLNRQRLLPGDVVLRNYKPEDLASALAQGQVDAVIAWEPMLSASRAAVGANGVTFSTREVYETLFNVVGSKSFIGQHPEAIKRVLHGLTKGARLCRDADAALDLLARRAKTDIRSLKAAWPSYRFDVFLDQGLILALEDEARWAIKNKLAAQKSVPNYLDHVYLDGLAAVDPAALTIIH